MEYSAIPRRRGHLRTVKGKNLFMDMKKVMISIKGSQRYENNEADAIELITDGEYQYSESGVTTFTYMESELTGLEGTRTSFTISPDTVTMQREGKQNSRMVFEEGKKHLFLYDTPYGAATMGVNTHRISSALSEKGGDMEIDYILDFEHSVIGHNKFKINIRETRA